MSYEENSEKFTKAIEGVESDSFETKTLPQNLEILMSIARQAQDYINRRISSGEDIQNILDTLVLPVVQELDNLALEMGFLGQRVTMSGPGVHLSYEGTSEEGDITLGAVRPGQLHDNDHEEVDAKGLFNGFNIKVAQEKDPLEEGSVGLVTPQYVELCYQVLTSNFNTIHATGYRYAYSPIEEAQIYFEKVAWYEAEEKLRTILASSELDPTILSEIDYVISCIENVESFDNESIEYIRHIGDILHKLSLLDHVLSPRSKDIFADMIKMKLQSIAEGCVCETQRIVIIGGVDYEIKLGRESSIVRTNDNFKIRSPLHDIKWVKYDGGEMPAIALTGSFPINETTIVPRVICIPIAEIKNIVST